jgi:hypothetical protein
VRFWRYIWHGQGRRSADAMGEFIAIRTPTGCYIRGDVADGLSSAWEQFLTQLQKIGVNAITTPAVQGATGAGTVKTKVGKLRREFAAACVAIKQAYTARGEDCTLERAVEDFYRAHPEIDKYKSEGLGGRTAQHLHDDLSDLRKAEGAIAWPEWKDL